MSPRSRSDETPVPGTLTRKQVLDALRRGTSLSGQDLRMLDLGGTNFDGLDLSLTKFGEAQLEGCSFRNTTLTGASFWHANLRNAVFDGSLLDDTDFDFADLDGCTFRAARLKRIIVPHGRASLLKIQESVRSGRPVYLDGSSDGAA